MMRLYPGVQVDLRTTLRFVLVGMLATAVYCIVTLSLSSARVGLLTGTASVVGFAVSLCFSYLGHARFTYRVTNQHAHHSLRFAIVTIVLVAGLSWLSDFLVTQFGLQKAWVALGVAFVYPPLSFLAHSLWSFAGAGRLAANDFDRV